MFCRARKLTIYFSAYVSCTYLEVVCGIEDSSVLALSIGLQIDLTNPKSSDQLFTRETPDLCFALNGAH